MKAASARPVSWAIGETPRWQSRPSIHWLAEVKKASRWYLIGSDYVWPWQSHRAVKSYIKETGGHVVGEEFVPLGEDNHEPHLARIRAARPDVVLISLIGTDSSAFNRAFGECGLGATTLRLAGAMDETVLLGIGADNSENMFCASGYFTGTGARANDDFQSRYRAMFGPNAPPIGSGRTIQLRRPALSRSGRQQGRHIGVGADAHSWPQHRLQRRPRTGYCPQRARADADASRRGRWSRLQADQADLMRVAIVVSDIAK
ncbi:hypothetical protein ACVWYH_004102 [Bradyrhizobium sp. GM24.11]